jgi:MFS family permease
VQDKPTAAYVLSLIGGILGLIVGFILIAIAASMSTYYYTRIVAPIYGAIGGWCLITSVIVIISAAKLNSNPWEHTKWGVIILVFSIIGLGTLLGLIGGILALVYKPQASVPQQAPMQAITRICPKCGRVLREETRFCPYCGNELG